ncbi:MAG TPA: HD domain-containing phosphohydrolase [Fimbriimonas sp.]|nr:HD domain-containing phosphohydrolase [Fimbriimonas sp.]
MKRLLQNAFLADQLYLKVRWALVLIAALAGFENVDPLILVSALAPLSIIGALVQIRYKTWDSYRMGGQNKIHAVRILDGCVIACSVLSPHKDVQSLWMLIVPCILFEYLGTTVIRRSFAVSLGMAAVPAGLAFFTHEVSMAISCAVVLGASCLFGAVLSKFQKKERILRDRDRRLSTLMNTSTSLTVSGDLNVLIMDTLQAAVKDVDASCGLISLIHDEDPENLWTEAVFSNRGVFEFPEKFSVGEGVIGYVAKTGQPIVLTAKGEELLDCDGLDIPAKAIVSVPLVTREYSSTGAASADALVGVMTIVNSEDGSQLDSEELDLLQSLCSLLANAIYNFRMEQRSRATFIRTLESLATALEARDEYTRGHSHRVCEVSLLIGEKLGLVPEALEELRIGTTLHDIGKIGVPDHILNKPGRLDDAEFKVMRTHPVIGYEICRPLQLSEGILMIIRNHHEKLDGSGYPDGLKGGELPLSLRIVCVTDAFDAMSSRRPYRGVMDLNHVVAELSRGAGVQFDPVVVEALKEQLNAGALDKLYEAYWSPKPLEEAA